MSMVRNIHIIGEHNRTMCGFPIRTTIYDAPKLVTGIPRHSNCKSCHLANNRKMNQHEHNA